MKLIAAMTAAQLLVNPAGLSWHETPTGVQDLLPYSISSGGDGLWTVGAIESREGSQPMAACWVGGKWRATPQPAAIGRLSDVAVTNANDAWAVGGQSDPELTTSRLLVQHWDGRSWKEIAAPASTDGSTREFYTVAKLGRQVWAAGTTQAPGGEPGGIVYRYDGKRWTAVNDAVSAESGYIYDILPVTASNVWIAAENGIKHYDGKRWHDASLPGGPSPDIHLRGLTATSATDIWAVGHREDPVLRRRPLVYHFDGTSWTEVATPADQGELWSVNLVKDRPIVVGESPTGPYLLRMTGSGFVRQADPAGAGLLFSSTVRAGRLWIAGYAADFEHAYIGYSGL